MKTIFFILFIVFKCVSVSFAQDTITQMNGNLLSVKILEIGLNEVRYKNFNYLDGPVFVLSKADIFMIKYANGTRELMSPPVTNAPKPVNKPEEPDDKIIKRGNRFYRNNERLDIYSVYNVIEESHNQRAALKMKGGIVLQKRKKILLATGLPVLIAGSVATLMSVLLQHSFYSSPYSGAPDTFLTDVRTVGIICAVGGAAILVGAVSANTNSEKDISEAIRLYNLGLKK